MGSAALSRPGRSSAGGARPRRRLRTSSRPASEAPQPVGEPSTAFFAARLRGDGVGSVAVGGLAAARLLVRFGRRRLRRRRCRRLSPSRPPAGGTASRWPSEARRHGRPRDVAGGRRGVCAGWVRSCRARCRASGTPLGCRIVTRSFAAPAAAGRRKPVVVDATMYRSSRGQAARTLRPARRGGDTDSPVSPAVTWPSRHPSSERGRAPTKSIIPQSTSSADRRVARGRPSALRTVSRHERQYRAAIIALLSRVSTGRLRSAPSPGSTRASAVSTSSGRTSGVWWASSMSQRDRVRRVRSDARRRGRRSSRSPFFVIRSTGDRLLAARKRGDGAPASPARRRRPPSTRHRDPVSRSASAPGGARRPSTTSSPSRQCRVQGGAHPLGVATARSARSPGTPPRWPRRSATAFAYEMRGCGEKPEVYAIGTCARRSARSKARPKSRWLVNRARPRLAYRTRSRCTGGGCCSG